MTDETPKNPWGDTRPKKPAKTELENILEFAREYQKRAGGGNTGGNGAGNGGGAPPPFTLRPSAKFPLNKRMIAVGLVLAWLATGIYQVAPDQQGVVMRFGKLARVTQPGLNYHLPYPFESVIVPNVTRENRITIGFDARNEQVDRPEESQMVTGDENIVDVDFVVTWQVQDIGKFLFRVRNPEELAKMSAESVMREIVGQMKIQEVLTTGRQAIEVRAQTDLQKLMDEYQTGILITRVNLRDAQPPSQVVDAFREVQRAQADAEQLKNKALAYQNDILPRARGEAERLVQEATAYKESVVARASGDAQRFNSVYDAYQNAKEVTKKRMYLETMEAIYSNAQRIIIDKNAGATPVIPIQIPNQSPPPLANPAPRGGQQ
jgi:membrane protease subunit HflK